MLTVLMNYLAPLLAGLVAVFSVFYAGKQKQKVKAAEDREKEREVIASKAIEDSKAAQAKETEAIKVANNVKNDNASLPDSDIEQRLRDKYTRR